MATATDANTAGGHDAASDVETNGASCYAAFAGNGTGGTGTGEVELDGYFYAYLLLFVGGSVFNLLTLMTLSHSSLRDWSTQVLLAALSVVDSLALFITFLLVLQDYQISTIIGAKSCKFF